MMGANNVMTVSSDGYYKFEYALGGTRTGYVRPLAEEFYDGSVVFWYNFYDADGAFWEGFGVPDEENFDEIYSGQDTVGIHLVRVS